MKQYYLIEKSRLDDFLKDLEINASATLRSDSKLIDLSDNEILNKGKYHIENEEVKSDWLKPNHIEYYIKKEIMK